MTDPTTTTTSPGPVSTVLDTAERVIKTAHEAAPWVEGILALVPSVGVPAAALLKIIDGMEPYIINALDDIIAKNKANRRNIDILGAAVIFLNHITSGQPNAPELGPGPA